MAKSDELLAATTHLMQTMSATFERVGADLRATARYLAQAHARIGATHSGQPTAGYEKAA